MRRFYSIIREQIAADVQTSSKIGGPGTVVEVDEAKFGKRKYNRGGWSEAHGSSVGFNAEQTPASWRYVLVTSETNQHSQPSSKSGCIPVQLSLLTVGRATGTSTTMDLCTSM